MLHGNGGANARFERFVDKVQSEQVNFEVVLPQLPGFEGRPLPKAKDQWLPFLEALSTTVEQSPEAEWIFYGHGIGGSILMEWAARDWQSSIANNIKPKAVILHSCIGASLKERFFPKLMKPMPMRLLIKKMIGASFLQPFWEKKLFLFPDCIPVHLRKQFFEDYRRCAAFTTFFDLITPQWYEVVQQQLKNQPFHFMWGDKERVVASKYLDLWKADFPNSEFHLVKDWDHFPMLEQVDSFYGEMVQLIDRL